MQIVTDPPRIREMQEAVRNGGKERFAKTMRYKMRGKDWVYERPYDHFPPLDLQQVECTYKSKNRTYIMLYDYVGIGFICVEAKEL